MKNEACIRRGIVCAVFITALCSAWSAELSVEAVHQVQLAPEGTPAEVAPAGALFLVQLKSPEAVLTNLDALLKRTVPENQLPRNPELREALESPSPILYLLGLRLSGTPLTIQQLEEATGVDLGARFWLAVYPGNPATSFIMSIPIAEWEVFARWFTETVAPQDLEALEIEPGVKVLRIVPRQGSARTLLLLAGPSRLYLTGEAALAKALVQNRPESRLGAEPYLAKAISALNDEDVSAVFDAELIRLASLQAGALKLMLGAGMVAARNHWIESLKPEQRQILDLYAAQYLQVKNLYELTEYGIAVAQGTVDWALDRLASSLASIECIGFGMDIDPRYPRFTLQLQKSETIDGQHDVSRDQIRKILELVGGRTAWLVVRGGRQRSLEYTCAKEWLRRIQSQLASRRLKSRFVERLGVLFDEVRRVPLPLDRAELEAKALKPAWTLPDPRIFNSVNDYYKALGERGPLMTELNVLRGMNIDAFARLLQDQSSIAAQNKEAIARFLGAGEAFHPTVHLDYRFRRLGRDQDVVSFIQDTIVQTDFGLFGYTRHTLTCSRIYHVRQLDDWLVYEMRVEPSDTLRHMSVSGASLLPAFEALVQRMPDTVQEATFCRVLPYVVDLSEWVQRFEELIRKEFDAYLEQCRQLAAHVQSSELSEALRTIRMPEFAVALCRDSDSGEFYLILPGELVYPRPALAPVLTYLLEDYAALAAQIGGLVYFKRVHENSVTYRLIQNLDSITQLIRSIGNRGAGMDEEKAKEMRERLFWPGDQPADWPDEVVVANPRWAGFWLPKIRQRDAQ